MRYVFFGTPEFAAIILAKLVAARFVPRAVVCNPDKPVGRKKIITPPPVKILALKFKIPVLQPEKLNSSGSSPAAGVIEKLGGVDCAVVAAYAKIIPKAILDALPDKFVGVHPSLLPKYRGATPIQSAILAGEKETGVTLYVMDEKVDHGSIISRLKIQISPLDTYESLLKRLADVGGELLIPTLPKFLRGEMKPVPQDEARATQTKKFTAEDSHIQPRDLEKAKTEGGEIALRIDRKIRAFHPEPGAWTVTDGRRLKLIAATVAAKKLVLKTTQEEGKKPVTHQRDLRYNKGNA